MSGVNIYNPDITHKNLWDRYRVNLFVDQANASDAGNQTIRTTNQFQTVYIERCERLCHVWAGTGKQFDLGEFYYGMRKTINLPTAVDELFIEWADQSLNQNIVVIPFGTAPQVGLFPLPIIDLWTSSSVVYFEESYDPRSVLTATRDYTVWDPSYSAADPGSSRALLFTTYAAVFRRSTRPYRMSNLHVGNDRQMIAAFWRAAAAPNLSRIVRLRRVEIQLYETTAVGDVVIDLMRISTEPTGGALFTPELMVPGVIAPETDCRVMPTAGGAEVGRPLSTIALRSGVQFYDPNWITLYDDTFPDATHPPQLTRNQVGGWAVITDSDVAQSVRLFVRAWFTEQNGNLGVGG